MKYFFKTRNMSDTKFLDPPNSSNAQLQILD